MNDLWPHQAEAIDRVQDAIAHGLPRICLTMPTGSGKTRVACELIDAWASENMPVAIYTNRRLLVDQLQAVLDNHGIRYGVRAAGHEPVEGLVQICSIQTEDTRTRKAAKRMAEWQLHPAKRVIVDECHVNSSGRALDIMAAHEKAGAAIIGLTATPIGIGHAYTHLIQCGKMAELRACGALVPAIHYGPDEPDMRRFKKMKAGEDLSENDQRALMMTPGIWGRVYEWFEKLNPAHEATFLFGPGVQESMWFAEQFWKKGIGAAHIDGKDIWCNGYRERNTPETRQAVLEASQNGEVVVLCNRFVLREGIDCPWIRHCVLATVFGALSSYLQATGRLLRACPGLRHVTIQDHGGNWHRFGSVNHDRFWRLEYTSAMLASLREARLREHREPQPARCPECTAIMLAGRCHHCGFQHDGRIVSRPVISTDGKLVELRGDIVKPRRYYQGSNARSLWERMYWRARSQKWNATFAQAAAMFAAENHWGWPPLDLPLMPTGEDELDWYRRVADVPMEKLRKEGDAP